MPIKFNQLSENRMFYIEATKNRPRGGPFIKVSPTRFKEPSGNMRVRRMLFTDTLVTPIDTK